MKFETFLPCHQLSAYIKAFVIQETDDEQVYKVLPGTSLVMGFQYKGKLSVTSDGVETALSNAGITGLQNSYRLFKNTPNIGTVLVLFKEAGAAAFFKQPLHELFGESLSLDNFMLRSELLVFEEKLCEAASDRGRIDVVEKFLRARLNTAPPDKLVTTAVSLIHAAKGNIKIATLCQQLYTSQSPLEKKFRQAVGASPKKYSAIVRFKHLLQQHPSSQSLTQLGYEAGFYDQAHFIKEFKIFTGLTPENYFAGGG